MNQKDMLQTIAKALGVTLTKENDHRKISGKAWDVWHNTVYLHEKDGMQLVDFRLAVEYYRAQALLNEINASHKVD